MSKRNLVIIGNWKMHKTTQEAEVFLKDFKKLFKKNASKIKSNIKFGLAVPALDLAAFKKNKIASSMIVAAQDIHHQIKGAYTGDLSAPMVKAAGANATLIGHSERRKFHHESDSDVNAKLKIALKHHLLPVVCIGETLQERQSNKWKSVLTRQVKAAMKKLSEQEAQRVIIAYEPIWAIGTGLTASADQAQEACAHVRNRVQAEISEKVAKKIIIQYGGSVKPENIKQLLSKADIDGALVGGASLEAKSFVKLLTLNN